MRKEILGSLAIIGVVAAVAVFALTEFQPKSIQFNQNDDQYVKYMARYQKSYGTKEEYLYRKNIYDQTLEIVARESSKNGMTYTIGMNKFADMSQHEKARYLGDLGIEESVQDSVNFFRSNGTATGPVDWRDQDVINPVKDQGSCGSCWSFSTVGPTEAHYAIKYGKKLVLAEQ